jgi:hypothetical protein
MFHERLGFSPDVIEAHSVRDSLGKAYNRTEFLDQRREVLQAWADYLDKLRLGSKGAGSGKPKIASLDHKPSVAERAC